MKNKSIIVLCITLILMISLIIGASYAYFSVVRVNANVTVGNLTGLAFNISSPVEFNFTTNPYYPVNENVLGISSNMSASIELTNNGNWSDIVTCGFDIVYEAASDSDIFVVSPDNTEGLPELVIEGEQFYAIDGSSASTHFAFDLKNKTPGESYVITHANILAYPGEMTPQVLNLNVVYYNYDFQQQINANKNIKGTISFQPTGCINGVTAYSKVVRLTGTSHTDSNGNPWTVKNENGYRYEGKDPDNYICFKDSCTSAYMYRIIGILDDEAKDGDTYYTGSLLKVMKSSYSHKSAFGTTYGIWTESNARNTLNSTYLTNEAISNVADKILTTKWYLKSPSSSSMTPALYYTNERITGTSYSTSWPRYSYDKIGLIYGSDFLYGSYETGSCSHAATYNDTYAANCKDSNYLQKALNYYTLSPAVSTSNKVRYITSAGKTTTVAVTNSYYWYPTFHLPSNIILSGSGTFDDPYKIVW